MVFDPDLARRVQRLLADQRGVTSKRMFGGVGHLLNGNMLVGVWKQFLIARVGPEAYTAALQEYAAREFDITGRPMNGWVMVDRPGLATDDDIQDWLDRSLSFVRTLPPKLAPLPRKASAKKAAAAKKPTGSKQPTVRQPKANTTRSPKSTSPKPPPAKKRPD